MSGIRSVNAHALAVNACANPRGCYDSTVYRFDHAPLEISHKHCRICGKIVYAVDSDKDLIFPDGVIIEDGWLWHESCSMEHG